MGKKGRRKGLQNRIAVKRRMVDRRLVGGFVRAFRQTEPAETRNA